MMKISFDEFPELDKVKSIGAMTFCQTTQRERDRLSEGEQGKD